MKSSADSKAPTNDEEPIRKVVAAFHAAVGKLDAHAFSMVFHEDADFTNVLGTRKRGRKAIEDFHRPVFEADGLQGIRPSNTRCLRCWTRTFAFSGLMSRTWT